VEDGPRVAMQVLRLLDEHALAPTSFRLREPSLDDVFLALTGRPTDGEEPADTGAAQDADQGRRGRRGRSRAGAGEQGGRS
jgi:hypothetical protein